MKTKTMISAAALATALLSTSMVQAQQQRYLLLAKGNSFTEGFEVAVKAAGGVVDQNLSVIGVAVAHSADPDFSAKASAIPELQAVAPDPEVPLMDEIEVAEVGGTGGSGLPLIDTTKACALPVTCHVEETVGSVVPVAPPGPV